MRIATIVLMSALAFVSAIPFAKSQVAPADPCTCPVNVIPFIYYQDCVDLLWFNTFALPGECSEPDCWPAPCKYYVRVNATFDDDEGCPEDPYSQSAAGAIGCGAISHLLTFKIPDVGTVAQIIVECYPCAASQVGGGGGGGSGGGN